MVEALLTSMRGMLGAQASQTKEFKEEAVKNNRNVSSVLKDLSSMFASSRSASNRQAASLSSLETITSATSGKVDRTNSLLQESISLQNQMLVELRTVSRSLNSVMSNNAMNQQQNAGGIGGNLLQAAMGITAVGAGAGLINAGLDYNQPGSVGENNFGKINANTQQILQAIKTMESGGDYTTPNQAGKSSASGAYQFIDSTWQNLTQKYGIGSQYSRAMQAPPEVQDAVAAKYVEEILAQNNGDVSKVPLVWFTGNPQGTMSEAARAANPTMNPQAYQTKFMNALGQTGATFEKSDESGVPGSLQMASLTPPGQSLPYEDASGNQGGMVYEKQRQLAGIRKQPLNPNLVRVLESAARAAGVDVHVYSGGQPSKDSGQGPRTGSTRHDNGNAADLYLTRGNRILSDTNDADRETMAKFVSAAVQAGATGVGAGHGYMGPSNIHVGFGNPATWGGAPWISAAAGGVYSNKDLASEGSGYGGVGGGIASILSSLGMSVGDFSGLISSFFGLPMGSFGGEQPLSETEMKGLSDYETNEQEPDELGAGPGRGNNPGGPLIGDPAREKAADVLNNDTVKEADQNMIDDNSLQARLRAIQTAAVEEKSSPSVVIAPSPETDPMYAKAYQSQEIPTSFAAADIPYARETRASWAPRIAVLRPDDKAAQNLTWAARINPNLA